MFEFLCSRHWNVFWEREKRSDRFCSQSSLTICESIFFLCSLSAMVNVAEQVQKVLLLCLPINHVQKRRKKLLAVNTKEISRKQENKTVNHLFESKFKLGNWLLCTHHHVQDLYAPNTTSWCPHSYRPHLVLLPKTIVVFQILAEVLRSGGAEGFTIIFYSFVQPAPCHDN